MLSASGASRRSIRLAVTLHLELAQVSDHRPEVPHPCAPRTRRSSSVSAGLPPRGGISTPVVFNGSPGGRPRLRNSRSSSSDLPWTNSLFPMSLPLFGSASPCGPWQAMHTWWKILSPLRASAAVLGSRPPAELESPQPRMNRNRGRAPTKKPRIVIRCVLLRVGKGTSSGTAIPRGPKRPNRKTSGSAVNRTSRSFLHRVWNRPIRSRIRLQPPPKPGKRSHTTHEPTRSNPRTGHPSAEPASSRAAKTRKSTPAALRARRGLRRPVRRLPTSAAATERDARAAVAPA